MISGEAISSVIKEPGSYCMLVLCGCREDEVLYDHELKSLWHFLLERYEPHNVFLSDEEDLFGYFTKHINDDKCYILLDIDDKRGSGMYLRNHSEKDNYPDWDDYIEIDLIPFRREYKLNQLGI